jgi:uncharacterized membrane protein
MKMSESSMRKPESGPLASDASISMPAGAPTTSNAPTTPDAPMSMPGGGSSSSNNATRTGCLFAVIILGAWLATSPATFDYNDPALALSDIVSGILVAGLAVISLTKKPSWVPWASTFVGLWLLLAPLVFKAPTAGSYINDTLAGILVITFVLLLPGDPGMKMQAGSDIPPGWSYNPSTWSQRGIIIALAVINVLLSRYLTAFQLGYAHTIWDPFFSPGTHAVLTSRLSKSFPISDAGLGTVSYIIEILMGFMGGRSRWRTMPWMVLIFGVLVVPVGIISILLIMMQPVSVGQWCTACLLTALSMLVMVALTLNEVVAMGMFLQAAHRDGQSVWQVFWRGGTLTRSTESDPPTRPDVFSPGAMIWGTGLPWNLVLSAALGVWLLVSPVVFGVQGIAANSSYVLGALVITIAVIAMAEVGRAIRFVNILIAIALIIAPFVFGEPSAAATANLVLSGVLLIGVTIRRGKIRESYGAWDRYVR